MKIERSYILMLVLLSAIHLYGQSSEEQDKVFKKFESLTSKKKYDDAEKLLDDFTHKYPENGVLWDKLAQYQYGRYYDLKQMDNLLFSGDISVEVKDPKNGKDSTSQAVKDSITNSIKEMLANLSPAKRMQNKFYLTCRNGLINANDAYDCCIYLRNHIADTKTDTAISGRAMKEFNIAEDNFSSKNYFEAAKHYKKAINIAPDFYKAKLYLGDVYYVTDNYAQAVEAFKMAVADQPGLLEPTKYLVDAYYRNGEYDNAYKECMQGLKIYPDFSMYDKFDVCSKKLKKEARIHWQTRDVLPNTMEKDSTRKELPANSPWKYYISAKQKIEKYCNPSGKIVQTNSLTEEKYLEVYSWEEMLKNTNDPQFDYAKKAMKKGYLDCYVFINCFHPDYYEQYKDFVKTKEDKINAYFQLLETDLKY